MNIFSIVVLLVIAAAFIAACIYIFRHKSVSSCCGDCSKCSGCSQNKKS